LQLLLPGALKVRGRRAPPEIQFRQACLLNRIAAAGLRRTVVSTRLRAGETLHRGSFQGALAFTFA
jgi:hypothetical protein